MMSRTVLCLLLVLSTLPLLSSSAHPSSICKTGGEMYGYYVDCNNHQASASFTWNTDIPNSVVAVDYPYRQAMTSGAGKWSGTVTISNTSTSSNNGKISTYSDPSTSTLAVFTEYSSDSNGHLTSWKIKFNKSKMDSFTAAEKATVAAHELGHAIGLNDLYLGANSDKLMYGFWPMASSPTAKDKEGAKEATKASPI
jgi:hypothetical protein